MKIFIGSDHAGFELKQKLIPFLQQQGHDVSDKGAYQYMPDDDYPDFVVPVIEEVRRWAPSASADRAHLQVAGIILGGSGQGEAIVANRFRGIRAVVFNGQYAPKDGRKVPHEIVTSREHNDANVLSLGARFLSEDEAKEAVRLWLDTPFSGDGRHERRIRKIDSLITQ